MIKVERNVPLPMDGRGAVTKYPWRTMKVGDSFFVPKRTVVSIGSTKLHAERKYKYKFTSRTVKGGVRIWRLK